VFRSSPFWGATQNRSALGVPKTNFLREDHAEELEDSFWSGRITDDVHSIEGEVVKAKNVKRSDPNAFQINCR
jgi:hypothetical protein